MKQSTSLTIIGLVAMVASIHWAVRDTRMHVHFSHCTVVNPPTQLEVALEVKPFLAIALKLGGETYTAIRRTEELM